MYCFLAGVCVCVWGGGGGAYEIILSLDEIKSNYFFEIVTICFL